MNISTATAGLALGLLQQRRDELEREMTTYVSEARRNSDADFVAWVGRRLRSCADRHDELSAAIDEIADGLDNAG